VMKEDTTTLMIFAFAGRLAGHDSSVQEIIPHSTSMNILLHIHSNFSDASISFLQIQS